MKLPVYTSNLILLGVADVGIKSSKSLAQKGFITMRYHGVAVRNTEVSVSLLLTYFQSVPMPRRDSTDTIQALALLREHPRDFLAFAFSPPQTQREENEELAELAASFLCTLAS